MFANALKRARDVQLPRKRPLLWMTAIWFCFLAAQLSPCIDMNPDSAIFLTASRNLSRGQGYTLEGEHVRTHPPLFPLLLSAVSETAPGNFQPEKGIIALCSLGALIGGYWLLSTRYSETRLVALGLLLATSPSLLHLSGKILSDTTFILFSLCFLAAAASYWQADNTHWWLGLLSAAALGLAALTRSAAAAFYLGCFLWLCRPTLWRADSKRCLLFGGMMLVLACPPLLVWILRVHGAQEAGTGAYVDLFSEGVLRGESLFSLRGIILLLSKELQAIPAQLAGMASAVVRMGGSTGAGYTAVVLTPIAFLGMARRFRKPSFMDFAFASYALMVLFWPATQGSRLWLPVLPLLLGYLADGFAELAGFSRRFPRASQWRMLKRITPPLEQFGKAGPKWALVLLLGIGIVSCVGMGKDSWLDCREAIRGVVLSGGPEDVARFLIRSSPRPITLAYSRFREVQTAIDEKQSARVMPVPGIEGEDASRAFGQILSSEATHLAVVKRRRKATLGRRVSEELLDLLLAHPEIFTTVLDTKHVTVFEISRAPEAPSRQS